MIFRVGLRLLAASLVCLAAACASTPTITPTSVAPVRLVIGGDAYLHPALREVTEGYRKTRAYVSFDFKGGNSNSSLLDLSRGALNLAIVTRSPSDDELTRFAATAQELGQDCIAVIVNPENSLQALNRDQVAQVWAGEILEWPALGAKLPKGASPAIAVVTRENGSGTRLLFETSVMSKRRVTLTALIQPGEQDVLDYVAAQPDAIGYVSCGALSARVRPLNLDGVAPILANVTAGKYVLKHPVLLVGAAKPTAETADFLRFVASPPAAAILQKYIAVK